MIGYSPVDPEMVSPIGYGNPSYDLAKGMGLFRYPELFDEPKACHMRFLKVVIILLLTLVIIATVCHCVYHKK